MTEMVMKTMATVAELIWFPPMSSSLWDLGAVLRV